MKLDLTRLLALAAAGALVATVGTTVAAATTEAAANAAPCTITDATTVGHTNVNCSFSQHWNRIGSSRIVYAAKASIGQRSAFSVCYADVTDWGAKKGIAVA